MDMEVSPDNMAKNDVEFKELLAGLKKAYPKADCALGHRGAFELLVSTILSAQCTDERVNRVTPALFARFPTPAAMAGASPAEVETLVRSTGFFRQKAKSIVSASKVIAEKFGGRVPGTMEGLLSLRGVARKTANVVLGTWFRVAEGIVVDTHVRRLSRRMGLTREEDPEKIEKDLMGIVPRKDWIWAAHALILHGRRVCKAASPRCPECPLESRCPKIGV
jgi:endonuclease III